MTEMWGLVAKYYSEVSPSWLSVLPLTLVLLHTWSTTQDQVIADIWLLRLFEDFFVMYRAICTVCRAHSDLVLLISLAWSHSLLSCVSVASALVKRASADGLGFFHWTVRGTAFRCELEWVIPDLNIALYERFITKAFWKWSVTWSIHRESAQGIWYS